MYAQHFNSMQGRSGTLWEGRYEATIVDSDRYLLACMRYIELNPVRAGLVEHPESYPWSSHRTNAFGVSDPRVSARSLYRALGTAPAPRRAAYLALFGQPVADDETHAIRDATQNAWALGNAEFRRNVERLGRRPERASLGRPAKLQPATEKVESDRTFGSG